MKHFGLILCCLSLLMLTQAQSLDQMTVATGSVSDARMSVTIGEPCIFVATHENGTLSGGAQGGTTTTTTGVKPFVFSSQLQIFPNPVVDRLFVQTGDSKYVECSFEVYDNAGKLVMENQQVSAKGLFQIDVSSLLSGSYILRVVPSQGVAIGHVSFVKSK